MLFLLPIRKVAFAPYFQTVRRKGAPAQVHTWHRYRK